MNNFHSYITPEQAKAFGDVRSLKELRRRSRIKRKCEVCGMEDVWRYGVGLLCFSCCTGEADASDDYELEARE